MGNWPEGNIWRIRSLGFGRWGMIKGIDVDGGFGTSWFEGVDVDGYDVKPCGGDGRGGMTDTSLRVCFNQVCSSLVRSPVCVNIHSLISTRVICCFLASLCNSSNSCVLSEVHNSSDDGKAIGWIVNLRCCFFIERKMASLCFRRASWED